MFGLPTCGCGLLYMLDYNHNLLCMVCDAHDDCSKYTNCTGTHQKLCGMREAMETA
jgi:hypothetical protein